MMRIFLINLDCRPDRLMQVTSQLEHLGLPFTRIPAVVGNELSEIEQNQLYDKDRFIIEYKKPVTLGEIGCAMSHRLIWQKMLDENLEYALILEDDIEISAELIDFLEKSQHYQVFDFLNLSSNTPYYLEQTALNELKRQNISERPAFWQSRTLWRQIEWRKSWRIFKLHFFDKFICCECNPAPALTSGYILSKKGAEELLKTSTTMYFPIDVTWRFSGGLLRQGFLAKPLIVQALNDSNIEGRHNPYKMSIWQKIKRFFIKSRQMPRRLDVIKLYGWSKH